ncbi:MAG: UPF0182 family protein [Gemmatimonadota bacterium]|nr:UPF0182 family protein [Gemmatimonadota bacterium]
MTARRGLALAGAALALALVAGRIAAGAYAEWSWFAALGASALWKVRFASLVALKLGLFVAGFGFAFANLLAMRRSVVSLVLPRRVANLEIGEAVPGGLLTGAAALLAMLLSAVVSLPQDDWLGLLRAQWAQPLGEIDPYLNRDLAFWTAWLPFERTLHAWAVGLAVLVGATVMVLYALTPSVRIRHGQLHVSTWVRRHFSVYAAVLLGLVAWGFRLDAFDLLLHGSGVREAFVAFDHRVMYPYVIALCFGTAAAALLVAWTGWQGYQRATLGALLLVLVAGPVGRIGLPLLDHQAVSPRERATLDRPYLYVRGLYTRRAFGVDEIVRGPAADSVRVPMDALGARVSGWDPAALALAAGEEPGLSATLGGNCWRMAPGDSLRAVVTFGGAGDDRGWRRLAVAELDPADADERGAPWPAAVPLGVTLPPMVVGLDFPPSRLVADTLGRLAAPAFGTGWRRLALAWGVRHLAFAFGDADPRHTRLLMRRDLRDRLAAIAPFFTVGATPQSLVVHDSLWWSVELFNTSADYPLTEPVLLAGAVRRLAMPAGLALVNAHSGRVQLLVPDRPDKMTRWWRDRLPSLFVSRHAVDADLLALLPPPVDRARVQGAALARTGFRTDTLSVRPLLAADDADPDLLPGAPTPFISGASGRPLAWGVPAVDGLERMRGVFVAVGGGSPRTVLVEQPDTLRWTTLLDRLQRTADSAQLSRTRRHPRRGRVQVIPSTSGTVVTQSFYEWIPDRPPALTGVAVLAGGAPRAGPTLGVALGGAGREALPEAGLRTRLARLYAELQDARRRGDWVAFGRVIDAMGRLIEGAGQRTTQ